MNKIVAIHQPNFFPWLGYFDKMIRCDTFVFLDDVQYQKTGGTWVNRVKLLISGKPKWITAEVDRSYHGTKLICEMEFHKQSRWKEKFFNTLKTSYGRHPCYKECMDILEPMFRNTEQNIARFNIQCVLSLCGALEIDVKKIRRSSELLHKGTASDLLCSITNTVGGDTYMCGAGAGGYQDPAVFVAAGIKLQHQDFIHPIYSQFRMDRFLPGLSIIDAAMNIGWERTANMLASR